MRPPEENTWPINVPLIAFIRSIGAAISVTVDQSILPDTLASFRTHDSLNEVFSQPDQGPGNGALPLQSHQIEVGTPAEPRGY